MWPSSVIYLPGYEYTPVTDVSRALAVPSPNRLRARVGLSR